MSANLLQFKVRLSHNYISGSSFRLIFLDNLRLIQGLIWENRFLHHLWRDQYMSASCNYALIAAQSRRRPVKNLLHFLINNLNLCLFQAIKQHITHILDSCNPKSNAWIHWFVFLRLLLLLMQQPFSRDVILLLKPFRTCFRIKH